ncbi:hypothetical protein GPALN_005779 [Globodera pallida]|nr:hypothetical protein GPALN_005779 [Globodera pallida]
MKIDAVDVKYSALFKMPTETEQISENSLEIIVDETYKLELEATGFAAFSMNLFQSVEINKLTNKQAIVLHEQIVKFEMMTKQFKPSAENNCEMWKFWRGVVNINGNLFNWVFYH